MTTNTAQTATYVRMSRAKGEDPAESLDGQRAVIAQWMQGRGEKPTAATEYSDILSAYKQRAATRPGYAALVEEIRAKRITRVVVRDVDRLIRSMLDLEDLVQLVEETGVAIDTCWSGSYDLSTPSGRQYARIKGSIAQGESEQIQQRVKAAKEQRRAAGKSPGGQRPFGWAEDRVSLHPIEAPLVRQACEDLLAGKTITAIAREWEAAQVPTPRGGKGWSPAVVRPMLRRWANAGRLVHKGQDIGPAEAEAIVSMETLQAVKAVLQDPSRHRYTGESRRGPKAGNLLSGLATCSVCFTPLVASKARGVSIYKCRHVSVPIALADDLVADAMTRFFSVANVDDLAPDEGDRAALTALEAQRGELDEERQEIADMLRDGLLRPQDARTALQGIKDREDRLRADAEALSRRVATAAMLSQPVKDAADRVDISQVANLRNHWVGLDFDTRRRLVSQVWEIVLNPYNSVDRLSITIDGTTHDEPALTNEETHRRRFTFTNKLNPSISFDPTNEAINDLMSATNEQY